MKHVLKSGRIVDFGSPLPEDLSIITFLSTLENEKRFSGQIEWSVLDHSYLCGLCAIKLGTSSRQLIRYCFLHDLHEAVIRDVPTPFKQLVGLDAWENAERIIVDRFEEAYKYSYTSLSDEEKVIFKKIDYAAHIIEALNLFPYTYDVIKTFGQGLDNCDTQITATLIATFSYLQKSERITAQQFFDTMLNYK